ncbi:MAG: T9SS type A sorting domain-containing protein, partial [Saprospiraceae bacterium]|nr:T9SS type A sorting domain-containing protein [Saprospiraceae bacterium]
DMDCSFTVGEPGLAAFIVKAKNQSGEAFYKKTNPDGSYEIRVTEGDFELSIRPSFAPPTLYAQCDTPLVSVSGMSQTVVAPDIATQILGECPLLSVELSSGLLRRCTTAVYNASWCNTGNLPAENASLQIVVSPFLEYVNSTIPLAGQAGDTLSFLLGDVLPGVCSLMNIVFGVHCDAQVSDVLCAEAHIFPDTSCAPLGINWDGSKIEVTGACNGSEIEFTIRNTGLGDMTEIAEYVIIEDQIMFMQSPLQLNAGQAITRIRTPMPEDSCFALQVFPNQHSILRKPVAVVANCTSNGNLSLLLNLPNNENDPAIAVHCDAVVGSFDPNDKVGFPLGLTVAHFIEQGQDIEYRIRFQNTGNDTAFLIRIFDTLPPTLDPATIRPIAASHPYTWDVTANGQIIFTFANILLPDSTTNEPASHGFVSFRISQKPGLADGTFVDNSAAIYFDFNEPVLTNSWRHTIGRPETVSVKNPVSGMKNVQVLVSPNPMDQAANFVLLGDLPESDLRFDLLDPMGRLLRTEVFSGNNYRFTKKNLSSGLYFWQIAAQGKVIARGRIVVK